MQRSPTEDTKSTNQKRKTLNFTKINDFSTSQKIPPRKQPQTRRKYLQHIYLIKGLYTDYVKNSCHLILKLGKIFPQIQHRKYIKGHKHVKKCSPSSVTWGMGRSKNHRDTITHPLERLKRKRLTPLNTGNEFGASRLSYITGRSVKCYNLWDTGSFFKN